MADLPTRPLLLTLAFPLAALALASCGSEEAAEPEYEAGVEDASGELIVTDPNEPRVEDVQLPEAPMTPVPADEEAAAESPPTPAAESAD